MLNVVIIFERVAGLETHQVERRLLAQFDLLNLFFVEEDTLASVRVRIADLCVEQHTARVLADVLRHLFQLLICS